MASTQEPEIQFAQRLASNEKPVRTKAIKKLRKYISVRSQKAAGGFTGDELLKLWKGLFYCLWMQDKPLFQEELSNQISSLIHSFYDIEKQMLYLECFLQTLKREWTGIDRLRMDKFFQLVRFMIRQTFEALKRKNWESSAVAKFLELLTAQLLQSSSGAPCGLQLHILDLYMTELAAVGSAELAADHNLAFIEPFCKTAAKTKDRSLFGAICSSIFSTIIDQAPFAIEDLMKEVKAAEDSDSGQASEEDEEKTRNEPINKNGIGKQVNGTKSDEEEEEDEDGDADDERLPLDDSDTELPCDDDVGPVLQFDYAALADKLFELASRSSTPGHNRQRLYKIIKLLRDLSEGIFPQDEYPEEVSTDEDDEMFGSRKKVKRKKRGGSHMEDNEEGAPAAKKSKGKKKKTLNNQNKDGESADVTANVEKKKKKKKKKAEENAKVPEEGQAVTPETESGQDSLQDLGTEAQTQNSISSVEVTEAALPEGQSDTLLLSEEKRQLSVIVTEEASQPNPCTTNCKDQSKKKKKDTSESKHEVPETEEDQQTPAAAEPDMSFEADAPVSGRKKKKEGQKADVEKDKAQADEVICERSREEPTTAPPQTNDTTPARKKRLNTKKKLESELQVNGVSSETDVTSVCCENSAGDGATTGLQELIDAATPAKKGKKKSLKADEAPEVDADTCAIEAECTDAETISEASQHTTAASLEKMTKKGKQEVKMDQDKEATDQTQTEEPSAANESTVTPLKKKKKKNQKDSKTAVESPQVADAENLLCEITTKTPAKKKKTLKQAAAQMSKSKRETQSQGAGNQSDETEVVLSSGKPAKKKKRKIPVVFEFEADELEEATPINGLAEEETVPKKTKLVNDVGQRSTPLSCKKSQKKVKTARGSTSDFITFQSKAVVPMPLFCKTKGSPSTPLSSKKKSQTPKSDSKKVTFGLKNNKTAEFRKTDRSLLVSPDGSSRVPFDPQQKPKFGVLKSPLTPLSTSSKKTPNIKKKSSCKMPKSTPKRRPLAADFF